MNNKIKKILLISIFVLIIFQNIIISSIVFGDDCNDLYSECNKPNNKEEERPQACTNDKAICTLGSFKVNYRNYANAINGKEATLKVESLTIEINAGATQGTNKGPFNLNKIITRNNLVNVKGVNIPYKVKGTLTLNPDGSWSYKPDNGNSIDFPSSFSGNNEKTIQITNNGDLEYGSITIKNNMFDKYKITQDNSELHLKDKEEKKVDINLDSIKDKKVVFNNHWMHIKENNKNKAEINLDVNYKIKVDKESGNKIYIDYYNSDNNKRIRVTQEFIDELYNEGKTFVSDRKSIYYKEGDKKYTLIESPSRVIDYLEKTSSRMTLNYNKKDKTFQATITNDKDTMIINNIVQTKDNQGHTIYSLGNKLFVSKAINKGIVDSFVIEENFWNKGHGGRKYIIDTKNKENGKKSTKTWITTYETENGKTMTVETRSMTILMKEKKKGQKDYTEDTLINKDHVTFTEKDKKGKIINQKSIRIRKGLYGPVNHIASLRGNELDEKPSEYKSEANAYIYQQLTGVNGKDGSKIDLVANDAGKWSIEISDKNLNPDFDEEKTIIKIETKGEKEETKDEEEKTNVYRRNILFGNLNENLKKEEEGKPIVIEGEFRNTDNNEYFDAWRIRINHDDKILVKSKDILEKKSIIESVKNDKGEYETYAYFNPNNIRFGSNGILNLEVQREKGKSEKIVILEGVEEINTGRNQRDVLVYTFGKGNDKTKIYVPLDLIGNDFSVNNNRGRRILVEKYLGRIRDKLKDEIKELKEKLEKTNEEELKKKYNNQITELEKDIKLINSFRIRDSPFGIPKKDLEKMNKFIEEVFINNNNLFSVLSSITQKKTDKEKEKIRQPENTELWQKVLTQKEINDFINKNPHLSPDRIIDYLKKEAKQRLKEYNIDYNTFRKLPEKTKNKIINLINYIEKKREIGMTDENPEIQNKINELNQLYHDAINN